MLSCQYFRISPGTEDIPATIDMRYGGAIQRKHIDLDKLLLPSSTLDVISTHHGRATALLWSAPLNSLIWSDADRNMIWKWSPSDTAKVYLKPAGLPSKTVFPQKKGVRDLLISPQGRLVMVHPQDRRVVAMQAPLDDPTASFNVLAAQSEDRPLNGPQSAAFGKDGSLYFTDPYRPVENDTQKEQPQGGVYRITPTGELIKEINYLTHPMGIAISPDGKWCYISNGDPNNAYYMVYRVEPDGRLGEGRIFLDVRLRASEEAGVPGGMAVHPSGAVFAAGPGGLLVISPEGKELGTIIIGDPVLDCTMDRRGENLYLSSKASVVRLSIFSDALATGQN